VKPPNYSVQQVSQCDSKVSLKLRQLAQEAIEDIKARTSEINFRFTTSTSSSHKYQDLARLALEDIKARTSR
jgi:translation initiation factor 2 alpha subunit (eIF-2alpha)